jgi:hypothetical protein
MLGDFAVDFAREHAQKSNMVPIKLEPSCKVEGSKSLNDK